MLSKAVLALVLVAGALVLGDPTPGCWDTAWRCDTINAYRDSGDLPGVDENGHERLPVPGWAARPALDQVGTLQASAESWANEMAATGVLRHSPAARAGEQPEVVGYAPDWATCMAAWHHSDHHREILLDPDLTQVGIGRAVGHGHVWCVVQLR